MTFIVYCSWEDLFNIDKVLEEAWKNLQSGVSSI